MADNDNSHSSAESVSVRVDLTSQDLRTGVIRLPLQLHDCFPAGAVQATAEDSADTFALVFSPPRELGGLQDFLNGHGLRTNDAVVLHVDGQDISLEPFYRRPRGAPDGTAVETRPGLFGDVTVPAGLAEPGEDEPEGCTPPVDPRLQPGLFEQPVVESASAPDLPADKPEFDAQPTAEGQLTDFDSSWAEDPAEGFDADFAAFAHNVENAQEQAAGATPESGLTALDDELPSIPTWQAPADVGAVEASPQGAEREPLIPQSHSAFHVVQRRMFTPRRRAQPRAAREANSEVRSALPENAPRTQGRTEIRTDDRTAPKHTAADGTEQAEVGGQHPRQQIMSYLDSPNLPSILQAKQVAQELSLSEETAAAELAELSQLPDSRLSTVRPGFYLLKRA